MSGTTSLCLQQQFHNTTGDPLVGGLLYSFQAGTLNPQNAFRSAALTAGTEYANPVVLDASARVPQMFYADGLVRLILSDRNGVAQFDYDNVPVIGSSGGSGTVDTTDVSRLFGTGDMKIKYGTGTITGYVRGNARTIGSSTSGATEFADATAQALFQYFWNNDASLVVTPSRGASAVADWTANKQIATPDFRGLLIAGLDGMGNAATSRLASTFGAGRDTLGATFGLDNFLIGTAHLPAHAHGTTVGKVLVSGTYSGGASVNVSSHSHGLPFTYTPAGPFQTSAVSGSVFGFVQGSGGSNTGEAGAHVASGGSSGNFNNHGGADGGSVTVAVNNSTGGGNAMAYMPPTKLVTVYFRL